MDDNARTREEIEEIVRQVGFRLAWLDETLNSDKPSEVQVQRAKTILFWLRDRVRLLEELQRGEFPF